LSCRPFRRPPYFTLGHKFMPLLQLLLIISFMPINFYGRAFDEFGPNHFVAKLSLRLGLSEALLPIAAFGRPRSVPEIQDSSFARASEEREPRITGNFSISTCASSRHWAMPLCFSFYCDCAGPRHLAGRRAAASPTEQRALLLAGMTDRNQTMRPASRAGRPRTESTSWALAASRSLRDLAAVPSVS